MKPRPQLEIAAERKKCAWPVYFGPKRAHWVVLILRWAVGTLEGKVEIPVTATPVGEPAAAAPA